MLSDFEEIFAKVHNCIEMRKDSLSGFKRFKASGLEGWLKVEATVALEHTKHAVKNWNNKGPDLLLEGNIEIELKAATDFNVEYIKKGALKYNVPCLFLADGSDRRKVESLVSDNKLEVIGIEIFSCNEEEWVIGMIKPWR
jgi:hypothetical protein